MHVPAADVEPYYKAYMILAKMLNTSDRLLEFRLLPGQVMTVDNRRCLHGRREFKASDGARQLQVLLYCHSIKFVQVPCQGNNANVCMTESIKTVGKSIKRHIYFEIPRHLNTKAFTT